MAISTLAPPRSASRPAYDSGSGRDGTRDGGGDGGSSGPSGDSSGLPLSNVRLAMMLALIASTMLFSGLIGAFVVLRGAVKEWPPSGSPPMPSGLWINTVVVVASSLCLVVAHVAQRRGAARAMTLFLLASALAAGAFLALQGHWWLSLVRQGILPRTNNPFAEFYLLTLVHFGHALIGFLFLLVPGVRALIGTPPARLATSVDLAAMLWHFVDVAWIVIWLLLTR